ncbi:MAG: substrate-binding domain-containing protein [Clostridia bacterium]|nr:substrate-binding domain-containing protein [Clostridia bacterium]
MKIDRLKLVRQIGILLAVAAVFASFNFAVFELFTKRCLPSYGEGMQAKSIELDQYLPFEEDSKIVKLKSDLALTGDLPVIDGAAALYPIFSAFVHANYPESSVEFDGESFTADSKLQYTNTRGAYQRIVDGDIDIAICAVPSEEQLAYAEAAGVELELVPIGREAFVFLVNSNNPVDNLTVDQIKDIYAGKYRNWKELGGPDRLISPLTRNEGSGSQTALLNFLGDTEIAPDYDSLLGSAIGFSFRFYVEGIVEDGSVKMLALNGVYPSAENVANGSYPIISEIYAVYRKDDPNENVKLLVDWMLSEQGQQIVEESGYCRVG